MLRLCVHDPCGAYSRVVAGPYPDTQFYRHYINQILHHFRAITESDATTTLCLTVEVCHASQREGAA